MFQFQPLSAPSCPQVYFIHVHPEYNYTNYRNDIAVLILSSPATITSAVRPVCLWDRAKTDLSNVEGKFGTVSPPPTPRACRVGQLAHRFACLRSKREVSRGAGYFQLCRALIPASAVSEARSMTDWLCVHAGGWLADGHRPAGV